jgi:hypothetical protein
VDYFDFLSRVNAVVVTAHTLSDALRDPELHKFAAHLLALLHVRFADAQRMRALHTCADARLLRPQQSMSGIREVRADVKPVRRRVQEQFEVIKEYGDASDIRISAEHQDALHELVRDTVALVASFPPGIAARLAPVQAAAAAASAPEGLQEPPPLPAMWTVDEVPSRGNSPSPSPLARANSGHTAPLGWGEAQTRPPNGARHFA